jgi:hypothetical protein
VPLSDCHTRSFSLRGARSVLITKFEQQTSEKKKPRNTGCRWQHPENKVNRVSKNLLGRLSFFSFGVSSK